MPLNKKTEPNQTVKKFKIQNHKSDTITETSLSPMQTLNFSQITLLTSRKK